MVAMFATPPGSYLGSSWPNSIHVNGEAKYI